MEGLTSMLEAPGGVVWGPFLVLPVLLFRGRWLTITARSVPFRTSSAAQRVVLWRRRGADAEGGRIARFRAPATAPPATVGRGNGGTSATSIGGRGASSWMWVTGLLGVASKYPESLLEVRFRTVEVRGEASGRPQLSLSKALPRQGGVALGVMSAVFAVLASVGIGNPAQGNSGAPSAHDIIEIDPQAAAGCTCLP